jgi:hypothetical protein
VEEEYFSRKVFITKNRSHVEAEGTLFAMLLLKNPRHNQLKIRRFQQGLRPALKYRQVKRSTVEPEEGETHESP